MTAESVVCDTGALISLEKLRDGYDFIRRCYDRLVLPPAVFEELTFDYPHPAEYLRRYQIQDLFDIRAPSANLAIPGEHLLHSGEIDAIRLAWELKSGLLIEESAGRHAAQQLGIPISGIAGQILKAYRANLISAPEAMRKLQALLQSGRIGQKLYLALTSQVSHVN